MSSNRGMSAVVAVCAALALPAAAGAATKVVYAGGPAGYATQLKNKYGASINNFLINRVTINAGDTVQWDGASLAGGFHTVDIPKLHGSDEALITPSGGAATGSDFAGNPFWFSGVLPQLGFNPALGTRSTGGVYNGTSRLDSGLPTGPPENFTVQFTKPGVYRYFCDVHHGMIGYVVVKRSHTPVPSARQDGHQLKREELHFAREAKQAAHTREHGHKVSLGESRPGGVEVLAMFPASLKVKTGTTVTFSMPPGSSETHTATFGPPAYVKPLSDAFQSPVLPGAATYSSDPPGHLVLTTTAHGNGFANTGVLDRDPGTPPVASQKITFAQAGTYDFICLIHPFMHGTIIVHK